MEELAEIVYQPAVARLLSRALSSGKIHSAYLFTGPEGSGKWNTAVSFAASIISRRWKTPIEQEACARKVQRLIHPDLHIVFPMPSPKNDDENMELVCFFRQSKSDDPFAPVEYGRTVNILMDNVRQTRSNLYRTPVEGGDRVALFYQIERMPDTSFDILLKTIEEPPADTTLLLLTDNIRRLPATILSRCQKVRFARVADSFLEQYLVQSRKTGVEDAKVFAQISGGSFTEAYRLSQSDITGQRRKAIDLLDCFTRGNRAESVTKLLSTGDWRNRDEALSFIRLWQSYLRDSLVLSHGLPETSLLNADSRDQVYEMSRRFPDPGAIETCLIGLLEVQKFFYRNISPKLALTRAAWTIADCAGQTRRKASSSLRPSF
jgi:DNA polymerase-3 subunit delta'